MCAVVFVFITIILFVKSIFIIFINSMNDILIWKIQNEEEEEEEMKL